MTFDEYRESAAKAPVTEETGAKRAAIETPRASEFKADREGAQVSVQTVTPTDGGFVANGTSVTKSVAGHPVTTRFVLKYKADPSGELTLKVLIGDYEHTYSWEGGISRMAEINIALMDTDGWKKLATVKKK